MSNIFQKAYLGSLVADAVSMPVHWFYDRGELDRQYGDFTGYETPQHPHRSSILFRSTYEPLNEKGDILGDQAQYWGQPEIHYHQFLQAGENTVNYQLARELYRFVVKAGAYDSDRWLECYIEKMLNPGWHGDTYVEEYHREFFKNYSLGKNPDQCGVPDIHIGGLAQVSALLAALWETGERSEEMLVETVKRHVQLTHPSPITIRCAEIYTRMLLAIEAGKTLEEAIETEAREVVGIKKLSKWEPKNDREVVGRIVSTACYLPESLVAALFLVRKYRANFSEGILANAKVGGDNCHRGAVVGGLLGAVNEVDEKWIDGLVGENSTL